MVTKKLKNGNLENYQLLLCKFVERNRYIDSVKGI